MCFVIALFGTVGWTTAVPAEKVSQQNSPKKADQRHRLTFCIRGKGGREEGRERQRDWQTGRQTEIKQILR